MNPKSNKNIEVYKLIKTLGKGSFGEAILVKSSAPGNGLYVMKIISMDNMSEELKEKTYSEVKILQKLNHPNIIKFHDFFFKKNFRNQISLHIIAEYADGVIYIEKYRFINKKKFFLQKIKF